MLTVSVTSPHMTTLIKIVLCGWSGHGLLTLKSSRVICGVLLQDALTLQRVCLSKKAELVDDSEDTVPDVPALVQELMLNVFVSTYSHTVNIICSVSSLHVCRLNILLCIPLCPVWDRGTPLLPLSIFFLIFSPFHFSLSFVGFTYFLLLSIPSLSTRIVPLRFQAGGRRKRPNLGLVCRV